MNLATECGQQLAILHSQEAEKFADFLPDFTIARRLEQLKQSSAALGNNSPVHAIAHKWLRANIPTDSKRCIVHGDFRLGNLLIKDSGLSCILDWELARVSHPEEDLGYLTDNTSRFGRPENPVGGFGQYQQLLDAYEIAAG